MPRFNIRDSVFGAEDMGAWQGVTMESLRDCYGLAMHYSTLDALETALWPFHW
jgi:hypothetical protein